MVTWPPLMQTRRAASGSAQTLNSAAEVTLAEPENETHEHDPLQGRRRLRMAGQEQRNVW